MIYWPKERGWPFLISLQKRPFTASQSTPASSLTLCFKEIGTYTKGCISLFWPTILSYPHWRGQSSSCHVMTKQRAPIDCTLQATVRPLFKTSTSKKKRWCPSESSATAFYPGKISEDFKPPELPQAQQMFHPALPLQNIFCQVSSWVLAISEITFSYIRVALVGG